MNRSLIHGVMSLMALCLALAVASGCTRGPRSKFIPPPEDPLRSLVEVSLEELMTSPELQLPSQDEYLIGAGDMLGIALVGRPDVLGVNKDEGERMRVRVTQNPYITLPYIGAIKVHGKTANQLQLDLRDAFAQYINDPVPLVNIEEYYYNTITVLGSVKNPGRYPLQVGDSVMDSIFRAGGLTFGRDTGGPPPGRYMKVYREKVTRKDRADLSPEQLLGMLREGDRIETRSPILIPIEDFINQGALQYNIPLQQNDIVYLPPAGTVIVSGHVKRQGVIFLGPSLRTLAHVLTESGGMRFGAASRVEIVRSRADGEPVSYFMSGRRVLDRKQQDFLLQDGDQIFVFRHPVRYPVEWISNIFRGSIQAGANATYNPI